jgi:FkbM family methyltransferase
LSRASRTLAVLGPMIRQVPPTRSARLAVLLAAKSLAEPRAVLSYAQQGEDLILEALLRRRQVVDTTYVDVGANHPVRDSNTYRLYLRGWSGVLIDANASFLKLYARLRPHDRAICAAVADEERDRVFRVPDESRLAGLVDDAAPSMESADTLVRTRTLTSILDELASPRSFGLLNVDCEGTDAAVIRSLDLERYRPSLIVVEQLELHLARLDDDALVRHLQGHGYDLVAYDGKNGYYAESD